MTDRVNVCFVLLEFANNNLNPNIYPNPVHLFPLKRDTKLLSKLSKRTFQLARFLQCR